MKTFSPTLIFIALTVNPYWAMAQAQPPVTAVTTTNAEGQVIGAVVSTQGDSLSHQVNSVGITTQTKTLGSTVSTSYDAVGNQVTIREDVSIVSTSMRDSQNQPVCP